MLAPVVLALNPQAQKRELKDCRYVFHGCYDYRQAQKRELKDDYPAEAVQSLSASPKEGIESWGLDQFNELLSALKPKRGN